MRTVAVVGILAASAALLAATGGAAPAKPQPTISIGPIDADFIPAERQSSRPASTTATTPTWTRTGTRG